MKKCYKSLLMSLLAASILMSTSCGEDDAALAKQITIDGEKVTLVNGYIGGFDPEEDDNGDPISRYEIVLTSSEVTYNQSTFNWEGSGLLLKMTFASPSTTALQSGTYNFIDLGNNDLFVKNSVFSDAFKDYNLESSVEYNSVSGTVKISKSGGKYKISFTATFESNEETVEVKGSFEGKLTEVTFGS